MKMKVKFHFKMLICGIDYLVVVQTVLQRKIVFYIIEILLPVLLIQKEKEELQKEYLTLKVF